MGVGVLGGGGGKMMDLEFVASACDISLANQFTTSREIITAMQAQEIVRAALAKTAQAAEEAKGESPVDVNSKLENDYTETMVCEKRGVLGFKMSKKVGNKIKKRGAEVKT